ncbi:MAG: serine hydroxymethyltransferase [Candidatus Andersenbacteria bacterium]
MQNLQKTDKQVFRILTKEEARQQETLSMIASENWFSKSVHEAVGSVMSHKYSEGNIGSRYYEGNQFVDELEQLAIDRAKKAFNLPKTWSANVQALSGSSANLAVYLALLQPGDTILAMYLPDGGHLSHGWSFESDAKKREKDVQSGSLIYKGGDKKINITSVLYNPIQYKTSPKTSEFDYKEIEKIALKYKPKLIITGGTAYPRIINHKKIKSIAKKVGALYMADIAHEAGLVAGGVFPNPVGIADVVTMTTHKTLRSGRGSIILAKEELIEKINRAILPGMQGGPHNHNIAGIAVGLGEATKPTFKKYAKQIIINSQALGKALQEQEFKLVTDGTDKHLLLLDLSKEPLLGRPFARVLAIAGITTNYSTMPWDSRPPRNPSALRVGTPTLTTRGMKEKEMAQIAVWMREAMRTAEVWKELSFSQLEQEALKSKDLKQIAKEVKELCKKFPLV